ncbi:MAG: hypothetical protein VZQ83_00815, partial [Eubacterium sp.]|nr:hypothetical protein [Eubacterium sp.]
MDNKKKNGLIRLLGKLGRKVKFLQKPLMVLVVVGVSIHHLFRQFFFDVKYHSVRMRALMGAMCVALLLTLFVIPAIADEVFQINVEYEEITSEEEATPTPLPEEEVQEENGDEDTQEEVTPDEGQQPTDDQSDADAGNDGDDGQDAETPSDDNDVTYEVDEEGNPVNPDENVSEKVNKSGVAVRRLNDPPTVTLSGAVKAMSTASTPAQISSITYGREFNLVADVNISVTPPTGIQILNADESFTSSTTTTPKVEYSFSQWKMSSAGATFKTLPDNTDTGNTYPINYDRFYGSSSYCDEAGKSYSFKCFVKAKIYYKEDGSDEVKSYEATSDLTACSITIDKKTIESSFLDGVPGTFPDIDPALVQGKTFTNPKLSATVDGIAAPTGDNKVKLKYLFKDSSGNEVAAVPEGADSSRYFFEKPDSYSASVVLDGTNKYYTLGSTGIAVGSIEVSSAKVDDLSSLLTVTSEPSSYSSGDWVKSLKLTVPGEYKFADADPNNREKYHTGNAVQDFVTSFTLTHDNTSPSNICFITSNGGIVAGKDGSGQYTVTTCGVTPCKLDDEGPEIGDIKPQYPIKDSPSSDSDWANGTVDSAKGFYVNGRNFRFKVEGLADKDRAKKNESDTSPQVGSGVAAAEYLVGRDKITKSNDPDSGWRALTLSSTATSYEVVPGSDVPTAGGYLNIRTTDAVGNHGYKSMQLSTVDNTAPEYYFGDSETTSSKVTYEAGSDHVTAYVSSIDSHTSDVSITVRDSESGLLSVKKNSSDCTIDTAGKSCTVSFSYSEGSPSGVNHEITAWDNAGNMSTLKVKLKQVDYTLPADNGTVDLGDLTYGDPVGDANKAEFSLTNGGVKPGAGSTPVDIVIKKASYSSEGNYADFKTPQISEDGKKILVEPKPDLPVLVRDSADPTKGTERNAVLKIDYAIVGQDQGTIELGSVNRVVKIKVNPAPLTLSYTGSTENYHTRSYEPLAGDTQASWFTDKLVFNGYKYANDTTEAVFGTTYPTIGYEAVKTVQVSGGEGVMTTDGFFLKSGGVYFTVSANTSCGEGDVAKNYYIKAGEYNKTGEGIVPVTVNPRWGNTDELSDQGKGRDVSYSITGTQIADRPDQEHEWYVSDVTIAPKDGYRILQQAKPDYEVGADEADPPETYNVLTTENESTVSGKFTGFDPTPFTQDNESKDGKGIAVYFQVYNEKTGEVSGLIKEVVLIDKTAPDQKWDTSSGSAIYKTEETEAPYFNIEGRTWYKFLNDLTFGLFFNNTMTISLKNVTGNDGYEGDDASRVVQREFAISATSITADSDGHAADEATLNGLDWHTIGTSENISEDQAAGYIYVRLTNGAGLRSYLSTQGQLITFDSKGPVIKANYKGQDECPLWEFENGESFVTESMEFEVYDSNGLYSGEKDNTGQPISGQDPVSIKVFKGKDVSGAADQEIKYSELNGAAETGKPKTKHTLTLTCPAHGSQEYTIWAKDNSGYVTKRYFVIKKPVYQIDLDPVEFPAQTYGFDSAPAVTITWKTARVSDTGELTNADVRTITVDATKNEELLKYFTLSAPIKQGTGVTAITSYTLTPKTTTSDGNRLHAGPYSKVLTVTYNDTDGKTKDAKCRCSLRVNPKKLTATFKGKSVKLGTQTSVTADDISVTGFIPGEGRENSADGSVKKASGYVDPVVKVPVNVSSTVLLKPQGGKADDYDFVYVDGVLSVGVDTAEQGTHYTISPESPNDVGWYTSNITITPKSGYTLTSDPYGLVPFKNNILLTEDTGDGAQEFYVKDNKTGQMFEKSIFTYRKDTVEPVIEGIFDGATYKANKKEIIVKDAYLASATVNGTQYPVVNGEAKIPLV